MNEYRNVLVHRGWREQLGNVAWSSRTLLAASVSKAKTAFDLEQPCFELGVATKPGAPVQDHLRRTKSFQSSNRGSRR